MALVLAGLTSGGLFVSGGCEASPDQGDAALGGDAQLSPDLREDVSGAVGADGGTAVVIGSRGWRFVSGVGSTVRQVDLTKARIGAWALSRNGEFTFHAGVGGDDGTLRVPDVPVGAFWLRLNTEYFHGSHPSGSFDLGFEVAGNPGRQPATRSPTQLSFELKNLVPWQPGDRLVMYSADAGALVRGIESFAAALVMRGATEFLGSFDYVKASAALVQLGDGMYLSHLSSAMSPGGARYRATGAVALTATLAQVDGRPSTVSLALEPPAEIRSAVIDCQGASLARFADQLGPGPGSGFMMLAFEALPGGDESGFYADGVPLWDAVPRISDTRIEVSYGDPYPPVWSRFLTLRAFYPISLIAEGATRAAEIDASMVVVVPADKGGQCGLEALVSPVRDLKVNGRAAFEEQRGVSVTPSLTWMAPSLGQPNLYRIDVQRLAASGANSVLSSEAVLFTSATEIRLPPEILRHLDWYVVSISAISDKRRSPQSPYRRSSELAVTKIVSAKFMP